MNTMKLSILFLLRRNRTNEKGVCAIECRITLDKQRKPFSTGIFINPEYWNASKQKAYPPNKGNNQVNTQLSLIKQEINQAFLFLQVQEKEFSVDDIYTKEAILLYSEDGELLHSDLEEFSENYNPFGNKEPYFWLKKKGKWGLFDYQLKQIIPFRLEYDSCELISDDAKNKIYIKVFLGGKCGLINGLLNVEVLKLSEDIKNIVMPGSKNFLVVKKNNQEMSVLEEELHNFESNSQDVLPNKSS